MKRGRNQRRRQGVNPNRAYDSNGPDVRIRGTANQIYDKYLSLARDAASSGDRVKAENYLQHAEHYFRLIRAMQPNPSPVATDDADMDAHANGADKNAERSGADKGDAQPSVDRSTERTSRGRRERTEREQPSATESVTAISESEDAPQEAANAVADASAGDGAASSASEQASDQVSGQASDGESGGARKSTKKADGGAPRRRRRPRVKSDAGDEAAAEPQPSEELTAG